MSDYISTRPAPNAHDTALAVFRPAIYGEAAAWLEQTNPGLFNQNPGFRVALDKLRARQKETAAAPGAGMLDHATAAYYRKAAASLWNAGGVHEASARLLEHVADDLDGGQS